jgi:hypothetical protein
MKTLAITIALHLVAIVAIIWLGLVINTPLINATENFAGVITLLSTAFGIYSFAVNILYRSNRRFYFWVNRLRLHLSRTHTYWKPSFTFSLDPSKAGERIELLDVIWNELVIEKIGDLKKVEQNANTLRVEFDNLLCFVFRLYPDRLHAGLDRRLLVPCHLYDKHRTQFARVAEILQRVTSAHCTSLGLTLSFDDGVTNPYYGYLLNRLPGESLERFEVSFSPQPYLLCRVEASKDEITVNGSRIIDVFETLGQVLTLKAGVTH